MRIINACILAAGQSSRFDGVKQIAPINGQAMLQYSLDNVVALQSMLLAIDCQLYSTLIVGANQSQIVATVENYCNHHAIGIEHNAHWQQGLSSSISCAVNVVSKRYPDTSGLLIMLADQPFIASSELFDIVQLGLASKLQIAAADYGNKLGVPAFWGSQHFQQLLELKGDRGANLLLNRQQAVGAVAVKQLIDIDYNHQLDSL